MISTIVSVLFHSLWINNFLSSLFDNYIWQIEFLSMYFLLHSLKSITLYQARNMDIMMVCTPFQKSHSTHSTITLQVSYFSHTSFIDYSEMKSRGKPGEESFQIKLKLKEKIPFSCFFSICNLSGINTRWMAG